MIFMYKPLLLLLIYSMLLCNETSIDGHLPNAATSFNRTSIPLPLLTSLTLTCVYLNLPNKDTSIYRTAYCGPNGVLIIEVSLYRTVYCCPSGVLIIEVLLYRTVHCGPSGVLIIEVSLYRTAYCGPNGVLIIEVPLYRTAYCGPKDVLITEVSLCVGGVGSPALGEASNHTLSGVFPALATYRDAHPFMEMHPVRFVLSHLI